MADQTPSLAEAQLAVLIAAVRRLSQPEPVCASPENYDPERMLPAEMDCRLRYAAGTLEEIQRLADEAPEPVAAGTEPAARPEPAPPLPPGKYGRVELPGRREHVGFIAEETRFGQQCAVVRDWNGAEIACAYGGPGAVVVWLPQPLKRPEIRQPQQRAIGYGFYEDDDDNPWTGGDDDDD